MQRERALGAREPAALAQHREGDAHGRDEDDIRARHVLRPRRVQVADGREGVAGTARARARTSASRSSAACGQISHAPELSSPAAASARKPLPRPAHSSVTAPARRNGGTRGAAGGAARARGTPAAAPRGGAPRGELAGKACNAAPPAHEAPARPSSTQRGTRKRSAPPSVASSAALTRSIAERHSACSSHEMPPSPRAPGAAPPATLSAARTPLPPAPPLSPPTLSDATSASPAACAATAAARFTRQKRPCAMHASALSFVPGGNSPGARRATTGARSAQAWQPRPRSSWAPIGSACAPRRAASACAVPIVRARHGGADAAAAAAAERGPRVVVHTAGGGRGAVGRKRRSSASPPGTVFFRSRR